MKAKKLSNSDIILLSYLRGDARLNLTRISSETGIPISTLFDKLKKLEQGVILKKTALLNFNILGYEIRIMLLLKTKEEEAENVKRILKASQYVNSAYVVSDDHNFFVDAVFRNMSEYFNFLKSLNGKVIEKKEHFIIERIKEEDFLTQPQLFKMLDNEPKKLITPLYYGSIPKTA